MHSAPHVAENGLFLSEGVGHSESAVNPGVICKHGAREFVLNLILRVDWCCVPVVNIQVAKSSSLKKNVNMLLADTIQGSNALCTVLYTNTSTGNFACHCIM